MKLFSFFLLILFNGIDSFDPIPPQPSQYTTSILFNGIKSIYYSDTTIHKERVDLLNSNSYTIIDYLHLKQYILSRNQCSIVEIPGPISPLLSFRTYQFDGNLTHNQSLCYKWNGCHNYQIPPAPFDYYATVKENLPMDLILPTVDINIHFLNITFAPPPSSVFEIPQNCTNIPFQHFIYSKLIRNKNINMLC